MQRLGGEGPRNMKSMWPPLAAIFLMTYFYRAGGGAHGLPLLCSYEGEVHSEISFSSSALDFSPCVHWGNLKEIHGRSSYQISQINIYVHISLLSELWPHRKFPTIHQLYAQGVAIVCCKYIC